MNIQRNIQLKTDVEDAILNELNTIAKRLTPR